MKKPQEIFTPDQIIEPVLRRRWLLIIPIILSLIAGIVLVIKLPRIYSASTLILIQAQKVPDEYVRSIVSADIDSRINTISQQIMSRSNLEKVISEFKIFSGSEQADMFMEDKIELMRNWISVDLIREDRRGPADAFSVSFKGKDPHLVMRVTNALASFFINENLKVREAQAHGTSDFLDDELNAIRLQLEKQEEALKNYRSRYMGGLPEQLQTNLRILEGLQLQLNMKNESLRYAKNNLILVEKQTEADKQAEGLNVAPNGQFTSASVSDDEVQLERMKDDLAQLKLSYTDRHPDIIKLKAGIEELEGNVSRGKEQAPETPPGAVTTDPNQMRLMEDRLSRRQERDELRLQIAKLESEIKKAEAQIQYYQKMVKDTPNREQELLSLNRDYENIKESYNSILARKLESDIAVNMEKKQQGEQFRILDSAKVPMRPSEPDMKKLFIMVIGAGIGLGAGLIFLFEYLDTSFRKPDDLEAYLEMPILCTVPRLIHAREKRIKRLNTAFSVLSIAASLALLACFTVLTFHGTEKTIEFVKRYINL